MPQPAARGFGAPGAMGASGGPSQQANFRGEPQDAFAQGVQAIGISGGQVTWQSPPNAAKFLISKKSWWSTGGLAMKYEGDFTVQRTGPTDVAARFALKIVWGSYVPLALTQVVGVVVLFFVNPYFQYYLWMPFLLLIGALGYSAWMVSSNLPEKLLQDIVKNLQGGAPAMHAPAYVAPAPQPAYAPAAPAPTPAPAPAPAAPSADASVIMEQIKQLAGLRDAGALTPEEFEAKKAELLKRI
ncbi:MAG: SHOCT domain-containing protein [Terricaulis sp.]